MTLRPQSAERPALQKFRTALNALYLEVEPSIANDIVDLANAAITEAEAYARAAALQTRSIDGKFGFKDGKIVNLVSGQEIPEDEPLFLLRARDHHAISVLGTYYYHASKDCNDLHLAGIRQVIEKFEKFKTEHPERMKQPGITRHLKLDESSAAAPAAPLPPESK